MPAFNESILEHSCGVAMLPREFARQIHDLRTDGVVAGGVQCCLMGSDLS
jgi:hypothetical protein